MDFINVFCIIKLYNCTSAQPWFSISISAIFVTLIYGVLRFANFATGDMMSFETMVTILFTWYFQHWYQLGILPTALLAIPFVIFMILYMLAIDKAVFSY